MFLRFLCWLDARIVMANMYVVNCCPGFGQHPWIAEGPESEWSEDGSKQVDDGGSSSGSYWLENAEEICTEDLPRLGLVQITQEFHSDPSEWIFADEHWPSHKTEFSHST
ncbi:hypothetical protein R1sor_020191 [Riccia sorocarpa]|uniref:Uncharacterized protein n=1 Tax=Riccia sorocarpa TaxID=122646 RepID=A0ABD3IKX9_9MARC